MGRIVVGVDSSDGAIAALTWAVGEAQLRNATLEVVHAWAWPFVPAYGIAPTVVLPERESYEEGARAELGAILEKAGLRADDPNVEAHVIEGSAASVLIDRSEGADLAVVGSRGHGGFTELLLGSVSQALAHHARCPVVIVPKSAQPD
jgi:nucleotide-binding universal stress UspA family protein